MKVGIEKSEEDEVCRLPNVLEVPPNGNLISRWVQEPHSRRCSWRASPWPAALGAWEFHGTSQGAPVIPLVSD